MLRTMSYRIGSCALVALAFAQPAAAQSVPTIDTEDAALGSTDTASKARVHPVLTFDLRNGDFARGAYDDDRADLDRLPVHVQLGLAVDLAHDARGKPDAWLLLRSSNGFHAPDANETASLREWYESNNLAALVVTPAAGLRTGVAYTIKASPNGVSDTTHEASLSLLYEGEDAVGRLSPTFAATVRTKGNGGLFTRAGIEPSFDLSRHDNAPKLSLPIAAGIGWGSFYGPNSGTRGYASAGAALEQPFRLGGMRWTARAEALALIRENRLAALSGPDGETAAVVPLVTLSLAVAY